MYSQGGNFMWVEKYKVKGVTRYRFAQRYKNDLTGKYKRVSVSYLKNNAQTRNAAQRELNKKIEVAKRKEVSTNTNITLRRLSDDFLKLYQQRVSTNTYYNGYRSLRTICNDLGNDTLAKKVTTEMLNHYLDGKLYNPQRPLTNAGIQNYKKYLSMIYKFAVKYGYLKNNPVANVEITWKSEIKRKRDRIENKFLTDEEYSKVLRGCDNLQRDDIKAFLEWLYLTGMRCGEAAGLTTNNIVKGSDGKYRAIIDGSLSILRNLDGSVENPTVRTSIEKTDGAKSLAGNREVLLPSKAVNIYKKVSKGKKDNEPLFVNKLSKKHYSFDTSHLDRVLHRIQRREGIEKSITTHIFRHTHVSKLAELGVPLYVIKNHVGHSNSKITEQIYLHVTKKMEKSLENKLEQL